MRLAVLLVTAAICVCSISAADAATAENRKSNPNEEKSNLQAGQNSQRLPPPSDYKSLVRSGYAPVNGFEMYYEIHGTGTGTPLITIHPSWGLANVFPSLAKNRRLIAVELRGNGRSSGIDLPVSFPQDAEDVVALMRYLEIRQADIFGESFGGTVATIVALRHPDLVRRVVTYGSTLGGHAGSAADIDPASAAEVAKLDAEHVSVQFQRESYERVARDPSLWPKVFTAGMARAGQWKGFSSEELRAIQAPILIALGDHDVFGPTIERALETVRLMPRAQLAVVPNAGHFILNEDPDKLLPIVATFLDEPQSAAKFASPITGYHPGVTR